MRHCDCKPSRKAFSLIEMIGVLAVVAILALVLVPVLIRQMDRIAGEQESASLQSIGDALQKRVMRDRYIPSDTDWATKVASELGVNVSNVTTNSRKQPRYFLIDPLFRVGANNRSLPYGQTNWISGSVVTDGNGSVIAPINPRLLIVSSIGQGLPNLVNPLGASDFSAIWDWNDASSAPPTNAMILSGFTRGEDLKVQRVSLSTLFVRLVLTVYDSAGAIPRYSIDSTNWAAANVVNVVDGYFIKGSVLSLYNEGLGLSPGPIDSRQVLTYNNSYVYNEHIWRPTIIGGKTLGGLDIGTVVDQFLKAAPNLNPNVPNGTNQQRVVVSNMLAYITGYTNWALNSLFPAGSGINTLRNQIQPTMINSVRELFENPFKGTDYTPVNNSPCNSN